MSHVYKWAMSTNESCLEMSHVYKWVMSINKSCHLYEVQGGEDPCDAVTCMSLSAKESLTTGLFCGKWPIKTRHPMGLRHPVQTSHLSSDCDMSCLCVTHIHESCQTCGYVMLHIWMCHVTHMHESGHTCEGVMSCRCMSHVTHKKESCHTDESVMSHMCMGHVTHMNESCHTHEGVMSHTWTWVMSHIKMCHFTHINETTKKFRVTVTHFCVCFGIKGGFGWGGLYDCNVSWRHTDKMVMTFVWKNESWQM